MGKGHSLKRKMTPIKVKRAFIKGENGYFSYLNRGTERENGPLSEKGHFWGRLKKIVEGGTQDVGFMFKKLLSLISFVKLDL